MRENEVNQHPCVLIVDDGLENRRMLKMALHRTHATTLEAENGQEALEVYQQNRPDVVLMDAMMPVMDGFTACAALRALPDGEHIPILMITSLDDRESINKAFEAGATDYITKPVNLGVLQRRVQNLWETKRANESVHRYLAELEERNAELDAYSHTIAHDLKNPLGVVLSYASMIEMDYQGELPDEVLHYITRIQSASNKMAEMIDQLLWLARLRDASEALYPVTMQIVLMEALSRFETQLHDKHIALTVDQPIPDAIGHALWIEEVFANFISNAIKYMGDNNPQPAIHIYAQPREDGYVRYAVQDNGVGIAEKDQVRLFDMFTRLHTVNVTGFGLGLSIVRRIVDKLNGRIGLESHVGQGSTFWFELPAHNHE